MGATLSEGYVHGYDRNENMRLRDQANTLVELLHADTRYPAGATVLEAGCGVGAQTVTLAKSSPGAHITSVDISAASVAAAAEAVKGEGLTNVTFAQGDIFNLPYPPESFDHVFLCFVLEHLSRPSKALKQLKTLIKPGGTLTVIEGDHGSTFFHPDNDAARRAIECQVKLQKRSGGNANIGRELHPLLSSCGFAGLRVSPRMVYVDSSRPQLVEGFTRKTFTAMISGIRESAIASGLMEASEFDEGIRALERTAAEDGVFCYTFFKAVAFKN